MRKSKIRANRTLCLPISREEYLACILDCKKFKVLLRSLVETHSDLFPNEIELGFRFKDFRMSIKQQIVIRRIEINSIALSIRPSFVMPYMTALTEDAGRALFLRKFAVPFWAIAYANGRDHMYWFRMGQSMGEYGVLAMTIRESKDLPEDLAADEKHTRLLGDKHYIAAVVAKEIILSANVPESAGTDDLTQAYGVFEREAKALSLGYKPKSVNIDGWKATMQAWQRLFPSIGIVLCFLHIFIGIRDRCSKKYQRVFAETADRLWDCYYAEN